MMMIVAASVSVRESERVSEKEKERKRERERKGKRNAKGKCACSLEWLVEEAECCRVGPAGNNIGPMVPMLPPERDSLSLSLAHREAAANTVHWALCCGRHVAHLISAFWGHK